MRTIENLDDFLELKETWDSLVDSMEHPLPFITHAWIRHWWACFGGKEGLYILTLWNGEKLTGILPLQKTNYKLGKIFKLPCLKSLATNSHSSAFNVICRLSDLDSVLEAIHDHLRNHLRNWSLLVLDYVPSDFGTMESMARKFNKDGMRAFIEPNDGAYYIDIQGKFEDYFSRLNTGFRDNRKYKNGKMSRSGKVEFDVFDTYNPDALGVFYKLEDTGWKKKQGTSIQSSESLVAFYDNIARHLSEKKQFLLTTLRIAGEPVASVYGLLFKDTFYFLKIGADYEASKFEKISPGQALLYRLIQYCFEKNIKRFDFYGPLYPYEAHWTKTINQKNTLMIFNSRKFTAKILVLLKEFLRTAKTKFSKKSERPA